MSCISNAYLTHEVKYRVAATRLFLFYFKFPIIFLIQPIETMRKKCPYSELIWSAFPRICTEYGEIPSISPYSVQIRENSDQNNSEWKVISIAQKIQLSMRGFFGKGEQIRSKQTPNSIFDQHATLYSHDFNDWIWLK